MPRVAFVRPKSPFFLNASHFNRDSRSADVTPMTFGHLQTLARAAVVADKNCSFRFPPCSHVTESDGNHFFAWVGSFF